MSAPTPQPKSVELANKVFELPLESTDERQKCVWNLRRLINNDPQDLAARVGYIVGVLNNGVRHEQVEHNISSITSLAYNADFDIRMNVIRVLLTVGRMENARSLIADTTQKYKDIKIDDARRLIRYSIVSGSIDNMEYIAEQLTGESDDDILLVKKNGLDDVVPAFSKACSDVFGPHACNLSLVAERDDYDRLVKLYFRWRMPKSYDDRKAIQREFRKYIKAYLSESGIQYADVVPRLSVVVAGMPYQPTEV